MKTIIIVQRQQSLKILATIFFLGGGDSVETFSSVMVPQLRTVQNSSGSKVADTASSAWLFLALPLATARPHLQIELRYQLVWLGTEPRV